MQNGDKLSSAIERIRNMEQLFDTVKTALSKSPVSLRKNRSVKTAVLILSEYYKSGLWLNDYELDENNKLPPELKRGVLSQDGLYDLLCEIENLRKK